MTCPNCGSQEAISKAEAWDAACAIPPKTKAELERLRLIAGAARDLVKNSPHPGNEQVVVVTVPVDLLSALQRAWEAEPANS
jgi:hypothetical protein